MKRVAVIGAGLTGVTAALRLAEAGALVDLYEREAAPLTGASAVNEGKIHLGYVYAMDDTLRTAAAMLRGAAHFRALLERWVGASVFEDHVSAPFVYAVPRTSMMPVAAIGAHFARVSDAAQALGPGVLRAKGVGVREMTAVERNALFDADEVTAAFQTDELAIDPLAIREALMTALAAQPRLTLHLGTEVLKITATTSGHQLCAHSEEQRIKAPYDQVINAAWQRRLVLDAGFGMPPERPAIHRYKCGLRTADAAVCAGLPSVTFLVGPYGDTVAYRGHAYASWYPTGLISQETGLAPAEDPPVIDAARGQQVATSMLDALRGLLPGASALLQPGAAEWQLIGGFISAWGRSGIDDAQSELHNRYEVGLRSRGGYHSIDSGKYTLGPLFAEEAAARVLG